MPTTFRIKLEERPGKQAVWVPVHPELAFCGRVDDETPEEQVREALWALVDEQLPGLYTLDYDLEEVRGEVLARIDERSDEMLESFTFEDVVFSLSPKAQIRYEYMDRKADSLPYPLTINSLDDRSILVLTEPARTHAFCEASTTHVLTVIGSGTQQKDLIRSATTVEELQAYVDPR